MEKISLDQNRKNQNRKRRLIVISSILLVLCLLSLFLLKHVLAFLWILPWIVEKVIVSGINPWLAKAISAIGLIFLILSISMVFSIKKWKRQTGFCFFGFLFVLYFVGMFFMTQDNNYDSSGKIIKCCAVTPYGTETVSCAWIVHPVYGTQVKPCTKEDIISKAIKEKGIPKMDSITPTSDMRFFAQDGTPFFWYYQYPDGRIELFDEPGHHPRLNVVLSPVNSGIVQELFQYLDQGKTDMITGNKIHPEVRRDIQKLKDLKEFIQSMKLNLGS